MKIGLVTFEQFHGRRNIGSSRIRARWLVKYWDEAELFKIGQKYDAVIYQKAYMVEHAKVFKGVKILDLCDPDWLHWGYRVSEMISEVDAITTSTEVLAEAIRNFTDKPVLCIPDRMDLGVHMGRKFHQGKAEWVVWFGYSTGFDMIKPTLHYLKKFGLNLIVISEKGFMLPGSYQDSIELKNLPWTEDTVNKDILMGDMVINPQSKAGKWKYKSNNKSLTAWALGMPVALDYEDLEKYLDPEVRQKESKMRLLEIKEKWDIKQSIVEYKELINKILETKSNE